MTNEFPFLDENTPPEEFVNELNGDELDVELSKNQDPEPDTEEDDNDDNAE